MATSCSAVSLSKWWQRDSNCTSSTFEPKYIIIITWRKSTCWVRNKELNVSEPRRREPKLRLHTWPSIQKYSACSACIFSTAFTICVPICIIWSDPFSCQTVLLAAPDTSKPLRQPGENPAGCSHNPPSIRHQSLSSATWARWIQVLVELDFESWSCLRTN